MSLFHTHLYRTVSATDMRRTYTRPLTDSDVLMVVYGHEVKRNRTELYTAIVQECTLCNKIKFYEIPGCHAKALLAERHEPKPHE